MPRIIPSFLMAALVAGPACADDPTVRDMVSLSEHVGDDMVGFMAALNVAVPQTSRAVVSEPNSANNPFDDPDFFRFMVIDDDGTMNRSVLCVQVGDGGMTHVRGQDAENTKGTFGNVITFAFDHYDPNATVLDCTFQFTGNADHLYPDIAGAIRDLRELPGEISYDGNQLPMLNVDRDAYFLTVNYDGTEAGQALKRAQLTISPGLVRFQFRAVLSAVYLG